MVVSVIFETIFLRDDGRSELDEGVSLISRVDLRGMTMPCAGVRRRCQAVSTLCVALLLNLGVMNGAAAETAARAAFSERFVIRLSSYYISDADTDLTVLGSDNIGAGFNFVDDLGGDDSLTIPRLDGFYRFNDAHRIEFSSFRIERDGRNLLSIDLDIGDQSYSVGDTVVSKIVYELFKIGYAYSFYRSDQVELAVTAGLNMTDYEFDYELVDGTSADTSDASGPLPMFGFRASYAINSRWSLHYLSEVLFIDTSDAEGSFQTYELDFRYRFNERFMIGAGVVRSSIDVTAEDTDWNGRIADTHRGFLVSGGFYLD